MALRRQWTDGRDKSFRYRVRVFEDPRGDWRGSSAEALDDAVRLGLASWDGDRREHYLAVPVSIEVEPVPLSPIPPLSTRRVPRRWTQADDEDLRRLHRRGTLVDTIGRQLGRTAGAVRARLKALGIITS